MIRLSPMLPFIIVSSLFIVPSCQNLGDDVAPAAGTTLAIDQSADSKLAQARALEAAGKNKAALKLYDKITTAHRTSSAAPKARYAHANLLDRQRDLTEAFDSYQLYIQNYPSNASYSQALSRQAAVAQAAAKGLIGYKTFGIRSRYEPGKITEMLEKVRDNAPAAETAPEAQFAIGKVLQDRGGQAQAIDAYQKLVNDYPKHSLAPEAQFRIGQTLEQSASGGNHDKANLDAARRAYEDLVQSYPNSRFTPMATKAIASLGSKNLQRSFEIAEFYYQKGQSSSAIFYFQEVVKSAPEGSTIHSTAKQRLLGYGIQ